MKRFLRSFVLCFIFIICSFPLVSLASGTRTITILYTGSVKGTIDPCLS